MDHSLSADSVQILNEPFSALEIKESLFQMNPAKAMGPDAFSALFFHTFWSTVEMKNTRRVLTMLNERKLEEGVNDIIITFVPKSNTACRMDG